MFDLSKTSIKYGPVKKSLHTLSKEMFKSLISSTYVVFTSYNSKHTRRLLVRIQAKKKHFGKNGLEAVTAFFLTSNIFTGVPGGKPARSHNIGTTSAKKYI